MPQKKKTNKKSHKKHLTQKQSIIFQSIPNYASGQMGGHQYNKVHVQFAQPATTQTHTDNIVGELVGKLMNKIENDGNKQTQEYSKEIQPVNNSSSSSITGPLVQIYNDGTKKEDKKPDEITDEITTKGRTVAEDYGIQTASAVTGLLGVGALGYAANSEAAGKAKMKLRGVGSGILGAVTSGASAIGSVINNNILKRGNKLGKGEKIAGGEKVYEKLGKPGTYARLEDEMNPYQADFDRYINQPSTAKKKPLNPLPTKQSIEPKTLPQKPIDTPTPTPNKISTDTPVPRINIFSPAKHIGNLKPQNILSPATQIKSVPTNYASSMIEELKDWHEVNIEANKLQSAFRNFKAKKIVRTKREARKKAQSLTPMEIASTVQPARLSGVHETSRQGATTTRIHTQNQAITQLRQQPPMRQSSGTAISNATTTTPQARGRGSSIKDLKPLPESEKRGRGRPPGSGAPKPMSIKYDKPGRPKLMLDPEGPAKK